MNASTLIISAKDGQFFSQTWSFEFANMEATNLDQTMRWFTRPFLFHGQLLTFMINCDLFDVPIFVNSSGLQSLNYNPVHLYPTCPSSLHQWASGLTPPLSKCMAPMWWLHLAPSSCPSLLTPTPDLTLMLWDRLLVHTAWSPFQCVFALTLSVGKLDVGVTLQQIVKLRCTLFIKPRCGCKHHVISGQIYACCI